ncbi:MAG: glycoside hydrolase family 38 C-terminal domain-containing protein, partial [Eubacteriales bacterium]
IRDSLTQCSVCDDLLFLNGCDHQPVQVDIGQIAEKVNEILPDNVMHSTYHDYFEAIRPYKDKFGIYVGELDGEYGSGWDTLANTASSRIYLKQLNTRCEALLEKTAEPLNVYSSLFAGDEIRRDYFLFMWKTLLQNHPHDSICGCSVDDVHSEMVTRFKKVLAAGQSVAADELEKFIAKLDTASVGSERVITVFNPHGFVSNEAVTVKVDFPEDTDVTADMIGIYDGETVIPADVEDCGVVFDYILPKDKFRIPFNTRRFLVTFCAGGVPALGYKSFAVKTDSAKAESELTLYKRGMSNERIRVKFEADGSAIVTDRKNGREIITGIMSDTGDIGDEYIYRQSKDKLTVTTEGVRAKLELISSTPAAITFRVTHVMNIPSGVDRAAGNRVGECVMKIENYFTLRAGKDRLDIKTVIHNNAENHRVVMLTKNDIKTDMLLAEGQYDIVKRPIKPWDGWKNPTKPGKMTTFFGLEDENRGVLISGRGLCEYEVLRDGANTMSLTLHRGIDQLGDWGYFPTPDAQCKGTLTVEYSVIPFTHTKYDRERAVNEAYSFAAYEPCAICTHAHAGVKAATDTLLGISGNGFVVSATKMGEETNSVILRVYNPYEYDAKMKLNLKGKFSSVYHVNLAEERQSKINMRNGVCNIPVAHKKIVTLELVPVK